MVFVSSDKDDASFTEYYGEMPWLALPFADRDRKNALSKKFGVKGIPWLVLVDENGQTITKNGRAAIQADPQGANFPWAHNKAAASMETSSPTKSLGTPLDGFLQEVAANAHSGLPSSQNQNPAALEMRAREASLDNPARDVELGEVDLDNATPGVELGEASAGVKVKWRCP
jgi:hypothetical protein